MRRAGVCPATLCTLLVSEVVDAEVDSSHSKSTPPIDPRWELAPQHGGGATFIGGHTVSMRAHGRIAASPRRNLRPGATTGVLGAHRYGDDMSRVLVTGAARGIGRATALRLAGSGWDVVAGVRRAEDGQALKTDSGGRVTPVQLDITDADQVRSVAEGLASLDAVVNNAGISVSGPVEGLPLDDLRRQLEVNLVGQVAVTQAVLPLLRRSRGRVVFVSSLSGRVATPLVGAYNASKFALEGIADALRMELRTWRVPVVLVEPAQTDTDMWRTAEDTLEADLARLTPEHRALYAGHIDGARKLIALSQRVATPVEGAAAAIEKALTAKRPRARYVVGAAPKVQSALARVSPSWAMDAVVRKAAGVPRSG